MTKILKYPGAVEYNTGKVHKCDVCGRRDTWKSGWAWKYVKVKGIGKHDPGYEEVFITCSAKCRAIAENS